MIRRPPRSTQSRSSAASDVYKRQVLFRLGANTDPQRDSILTRGPADVLDHATPEIAIGSKMGLDATRKLAGEGFKREWPPIIKMDETIKRKVDELLGS